MEKVFTTVKWSSLPEKVLQDLGLTKNHQSVKNLLFMFFFSDCLNLCVWIKGEWVNEPYDHCSKTFSSTLLLPVISYSV
jgi:hypothetical protein